LSLISASSPYCYNSYHEVYPEIHVQYDQYYEPNFYPSRLIQLDDSPSCYLGCDVYPRQYETHYGRRMMQEPIRLTNMQRMVPQMSPNRYSTDWHLGIFRGQLI